MRKKILVVIIGIHKAQEHEWFIQLLNHDLFDVEFALINCENSFMSKFLLQNNIVTWHYKYNGKSDLAGLTTKLFLRMRKGKYDIVHTHLFEACLAGLFAAFLSHVPMRIMTRHYSDYHHVWFPGSVKYDKLMNFLATDIIAISLNVYKILTELEGVRPTKVKLIHHGICIPDYQPGAVTPERILRIRDKYNILGTGPVVGAISRMTEWKGLQFFVPAFKRILNLHNDAVMVLANATGDFKTEILSLMEGIPDKNYRLIEFEDDIAALYKVFDCFVHIPINSTTEAFGQTYIESLASRVPSVFTVSGVASEFAIDRKNCFIVPFCDAEAVYNAVKFVLDNNSMIQDVINTGYNEVVEKFDVNIKIRKLEMLYSGGYEK